MKPSEALAKHREEALAILARYPVTNPRIFGSVARGEDKEDSDLDIMVKRTGEFSYYDLFRLEDGLSEAFGVKVDVRTEGEFTERLLRRLERDLRPL